MEKRLTITFLLKITRLLFLPLLFSIHLQLGAEALIGVNYGTVGDNLPPPPRVAQFLANSTIITRVRIFDSDPQMLRAFANTGIAVSVTIPNDQIPQLTKLYSARQWVSTNIGRHVHTNIVRILVGNEVLSTANKLLISNLVPAMQALQSALVDHALDGRIKISTPHSLGILSNSTPPSTGKFRQGYDVYVMKPLLAFLRATNSPFVINPYPFFACAEESLDYALFKANKGYLDEETNQTYANMLDAQMDAVYSAIRRLGFEDVEVVIGETGWPWKGDAGKTGADRESAGEYNRRLVRHVTSGVGTPLMPGRTFETYIFALFNEDLKPGPVCERNFGLFEPDFTPVYDNGVVKSMVAANAGESVRCSGGGGCTCACLCVILLHIVCGFLLDY